MSINPQAAEDIKAWLALDNELRVHKNVVKTLSERKLTLETRIKTYVQTNNLTNVHINVSDGKLRFDEKKTTSGLTLKFLKEQLANFFAEASRKATAITSDAIYAYVVGNRKEMTNLEMIREIGEGAH